MTESADCHTPAPEPARSNGTRPQIVLAGNPNVGKTTLFNALTGSSAKVSNYPGITVERRRGALELPQGTADLHDLPGTYSVNARSVDEQIALDALVGLGGDPAPDVVIVCLDATQLARSTYLLLQCRELGARCVGALTMVDEAGDAAPDARAFAELVGCEVVAVTARTRRGLPELTAAIDRAVRPEMERGGLAPTLGAARRATWTWTPSPSYAAISTR